MKLTCVFLLSSFVVSCIAPDSIPRKDVFKNSHFISGTLMVLRHDTGSGPKPITKFEMIVDALQEFKLTYVPDFRGMPCSPAEDVEHTEHEALGSKCAISCRDELTKVLNSSPITDQGIVLNLLFYKVLQRIFLPNPTKMPLEEPAKHEDNMKNFVRALVKKSFELDTKTKSMLDCFGSKLYGYYADDDSRGKRKGIERMTKETLELIHAIADAQRNTPLT